MRSGRRDTTTTFNVDDFDLIWIVETVHDSHHSSLDLAFLSPLCDLQPSALSMEVEHLHEYEDLDSSSSSSENHSSPSTNSDSAYSATSHPEWALDLGISIPTLHSNWTHPAAFKAAPIPSTSSGMHTSDPYFWDAPQRDTGVTVDQQSGAAMSGKRQVQREVGTEADTSLDAFPGNDPRRSIEMEFDDMINEDSCG